MGAVGHVERPCSVEIASSFASTWRHPGFRSRGEFPRFFCDRRAPGDGAQEMLIDVPMSSVMHTADPTSRTAGQYARATVRRLRMRTLVTLGVLAVATALLGRTFGLHDKRFLASEVALLVSMFVISRYVLPLVERRDRGATGEEQVGGLLDQLSDREWRVIHDASLGRGNMDHIAIGPPGVFTVETKSHPGPVRVGRVHGAALSQARAQSRAIERVTGDRKSTRL